MGGLDSVAVTPFVVTVTLTVPTPAGAVASMVVPSELTLVILAEVPPKVTRDEEVKPAPMIFTVVPPGPDVGSSEVTVEE